MQDRNIIEVRDVDETEYAGPVECMSANTDMSSACTKQADKEIVLEYPDDPKVAEAYVCLCEDCASEYVKKWDEAQIFGE